MNKQRITQILNQKNLNEVYYNQRPVWIQELKDNVAKIGVMDTNEEKDVYIEDLYERDLYE